MIARFGTGQVRDVLKTSAIALRTARAAWCRKRSDSGAVGGRPESRWEMGGRDAWCTRIDARGIQ